MWVCLTICLRPLKQDVKRTHKAAPPHYVVAADIAHYRSQVNRVVLFCSEETQGFHCRKRLENDQVYTGDGKDEIARCLQQRRVKPLFHDLRKKT